MSALLIVALAIGAYLLLSIPFAIGLGRVIALGDPESDYSQKRFPSQSQATSEDAATTRA